MDKQKNYINYEPHKYNCISVDDDIMTSLNQHLATMKTYFHTFSRPDFGLAYFGITLIPTESLSFFYDAVTSSEYFKDSDELNELAALIIQAIKEKKYIIHFGV